MISLFSIKHIGIIRKKINNLFYLIGNLFLIYKI